MADNKNSKKRKTSSAPKKSGRASTKKTSSARNAASEPAAELHRDIILWSVLGVSVLLLISEFGIGGKVGNAVGGFLFGVFGLIAYLFPFALFIGTLFIVSNRENRVAVMKLIAGVLFVLFLCLLCSLITHGAELKTVYGAAKEFAYSREHHTGGGFFGGLIGNLLTRWFGVVGAYVIDITVLFVTLLLLMERSAFSFLEKNYKEYEEGAPERNERRNARRQERAEERRLRREEDALERADRRREREERLAEERARQEELAKAQAAEGNRRDRHVSGVTTDTVLAAGDKADDASRVASAAGSAVHSSSGNVGGSGAATANGGAGAEPVSQKKSDNISEVKISIFNANDGEGSDGTGGTSSSEAPAIPVEHIALTSGEASESTVEVSDVFGAGDELSADDECSVGGEHYGSGERAEHIERIEHSNRVEHSDRAELERDIASSVEDLRAAEAQEPLWEAAEETAPETSEMKELSNGQSDDEVSADAIDWESIAAEPAEQSNARAASADGSLHTATSVDAANTSRGTKADEQKAVEPVAPAAPPKMRREDYKYPPVDLLARGKGAVKNQEAEIRKTSEKLEKVLSDFGVNARVTEATCGPAVTRYEIEPESGVKVSKIVNLSDDIKLNLAAADIRIEAPIPGKAAVGIEVPNKEAAVVTFRELIESKEFEDYRKKSNIAFAAGRDIAGKVIISDIAKMPHVLIAGATGSGKSVCINTVIMSILYHAHPDDVKFIMIDPKVVELSVYNGIPHLLIPVVTDPKKAAGALQWAVQEMMKRYELFAQAGVRQMSEFNARIKRGQITLNVNGEQVEVVQEKLPQIVVIVDELADLMMVASKEVEDAICRLAQLARAAGIHLIIATQRPSVNVITGLIKANMPSRIAFAVTSGIDSRTILDMIGAEKLLGKGDMLYFPQGLPKPLRVQGAFCSDEEVRKVTDFIRNENSGFSGEQAARSAEIATNIEQSEANKASADATAIDGDDAFSDDRDSYFEQAGRLIIEKEKGSIGFLQRNFKVGFNRAARIMDQLEEAGVVGPEMGTKPRSVLMTVEQFEEYLRTG